MERKKKLNEQLGIWSPKMFYVHDWGSKNNYNNIKKGQLLFAFTNTRIVYKNTIMEKLL